MKRYSHIRGSQPRLASLVCPFQRKGREIVVIRGQGLVLPPTYATHFSAFLICLSYRQYPIRPFGAPSPRGEGWRYEENLRSTDLRASPRFVILSGEKRRM